MVLYTAGRLSVKYFSCPWLSWLFMITSWHGNVCDITGPLGGKPPVTGGFPSEKASFDVFDYVPRGTISQFIAFQYAWKHYPAWLHFMNTFLAFKESLFILFATCNQILKQPRPQMTVLLASMLEAILNAKARFNIRIVFLDVGFPR